MILLVSAAAFITAKKMKGISQLLSVTQDVFYFIVYNLLPLGGSSSNIMMQ